jgi:hypothetical protein
LLQTCQQSLTEAYSCASTQEEKMRNQLAEQVIYRHIATNMPAVASDFYLCASTQEEKCAINLAEQVLNGLDATIILSKQQHNRSLSEGPIKLLSQTSLLTDMFRHRRRVKEPAYTGLQKLKGD